MSEAPEIVTYKIPRIEVYQVTDHELSRIEETYGQAGQDLTFAIASLSLAISFAISLSTGTFSDRLFVTFVLFAIVSSIVTIYTALRWWRVRKVTPTVIAAIRSRRVDPQPVSSNDPSGE